jgi:hypothetical protein
MPKIYSSRAMTRAMSIDYPVGDPTGGPAYGEKNDPVTIGLSIAGMAEAGEAMMAGSIMGGLQFAGSALTLVGTLSGNKTLSKIGMVAGLAGFAGSMGAFGDAAKSATWGNTFGGSSPTTGAEAMSSDKLSQTVNVNNNPSTMDVANKPGFMDTPVNDQIAKAEGPGFSNVNQGTAGSNAEFVNNENLGQNSPTLSNQSTAPINQGTAPLNQNAVSPNAAGDKSTFGKTMEWVGKNPYGALAIGQLAMPIADYLSGKTDAEIDALKAQTGYADAKALEIQTALDREKQRRANLNAGYGQVNTGFNVNTNAAVNPAAVQAQAQGNGIIANAVRPA